jgi:type III secretory pathway component EscV
MENETKQMGYSLVKGLGLKSILIVAFIVFTLFVAYKYISSNIQESKEKAIIYERSMIQRQQEDKEAENNKKKEQAELQITLQLNNCIAQAEKKLNANIQRWRVDFKTENCDNAVYENVKLECFNTVIKMIDKAKAEAIVDKDDCYKRYK